MRTPKAFKPVLESSSSGTEKRGSNFAAQDRILLSNGGNSYEKKQQDYLQGSASSKKNVMSYLRSGMNG